MQALQLSQPPFPPQLSSNLAISSASSRFACSSSRRFFGERKNARSLPSTGTGQIQPQNARPNKNTSSAMMMMLNTARGTKVLVANMVVMAPSGHSALKESKPKPDSVPMLMPAIKPTARTQNTAAATMVRILLNFMTTPLTTRTRDGRRWRARWLPLRWSLAAATRTRSRRRRSRRTCPRSRTGAGCSRCRQAGWRRNRHRGRRRIRNGSPCRGTPGTSCGRSRLGR